MLPSRSAQQQPSSRLMHQLQVSFSAATRGRYTAIAIQPGAQEQCPVRRCVALACNRQNPHHYRSSLSFHPKFYFHCLCKTPRHRHPFKSAPPIPLLEMSELKTPTLADWMRWEPVIRAKYKKLPLRIIRQEMEGHGLRVT